MAWKKVKDRFKDQFVFDYRPVIAWYALWTMWQGFGWMTDDAPRFSAAAFDTLDRWAGHLGLPVQAWGFPMVIGGVLVFVGMMAGQWRMRWIGYAISSLTFLTIAEGIRNAGQMHPEASQSGFRSYIFFGVLPIILANVAQIHARRRRRREVT